MSERALTLPHREVALTLPNRNIKPTTGEGGTGNSLIVNLLLQGFNATTAFDTTGFLLYGLYTSPSSTTTYYDLPGILTLRRRPVALEVVA